MKILSIETSCDETAVSIVQAEGSLENPSFEVLGNGLFSQIDIHKEYGGVYPNLAKREHGKNLLPLTEKALKEAGLEKNISKTNNELFKLGLTDLDEFRGGNGLRRGGVLRYDDEHEVISNKEIRQVRMSYEQKISEIEKDLEREVELQKNFASFAKNFPENPGVDLIAVTAGPGLEPALWVGINFAKALHKLWNIPVKPVNHMEGHICSVLLSEQNNKPINFPAVALLISGGHTELVEISGWGKYKILGQTKDDAVGEAFDKVARMLGLPYPGGPQISKLAEIARDKNQTKICKLPRPMIHSKDFNFSFSGLKTAVLYYIKKLPSLTENDKTDIAREFEDAVIEVLKNKTSSALENVGAKTLIIAGGVIANKAIRNEFLNYQNKFPELSVLLPTQFLSTDNSVMIACAAYLEMLTSNTKTQEEIRANGNLSFI